MWKTVLLIVLLALRAAAQQGDTEDEARAGMTNFVILLDQQRNAHRVTPAPLQLHEDQILYVRSWKPFDPATMLVQAGCALVTETVAWFAGFYLFSGTEPGGFDRLGAMMLGGHLFAALVGAPAGTQLGGGLMRGNGKFYGTLAGSVVGTILSTATMYLLRGSSDPWLIVGGMFASYTVPVIVGYHLTASPMNYYFYDDAPEASARAERLSRTPASRDGGSGFVRMESASLNDPVRPRPDIQITLLRIPF